MGLFRRLVARVGKGPESDRDEYDPEPGKGQRAGVFVHQQRCPNRIEERIERCDQGTVQGGSVADRKAVDNIGGCLLKKSEQQDAGDASRVPGKPASDKEEGAHQDGGVDVSKDVYAQGFRIAFGLAVHQVHDGGGYSDRQAEKISQHGCVAGSLKGQHGNTACRGEGYRDVLAPETLPEKEHRKDQNEDRVGVLQRHHIGARSQLVADGEADELQHYCEADGEGQPVDHQLFADQLQVGKQNDPGNQAAHPGDGHPIPANQLDQRAGGAPQEGTGCHAEQRVFGCDGPIHRKFHRSCHSCPDTGGFAGKEAPAGTESSAPAQSFQTSNLPYRLFLPKIFMMTS